MGMRLATRRELAKSRELLHFLLDGKTCWFCHELLNPNKNAVKGGDSDGSPTSARELTIHHKDGNHQNDAPRNKTLCHTSCHKAYHMRLLWKQKKLQRGTR